MDKARSYHEGHDRHREVRGRDGQLPGRVRDEPLEATRSVAIPSLEIDQPDCRRAAHASSVGPIDESQLFYLESRGIPPDEARKFIVLGFLEPVVARVPLVEAQDRLRELLEAKWDAGSRHGGRRRRVRRIDLLGVDEVPPGTMKMAWVDGTDQVLVVNSDGELSRHPGRLQPRVLRARQGLPDGRHADLRAAPVALRPRERRAARSAGRAAAGGLSGGRRGRPDPHRGPRRPARGERVRLAGPWYECPVSSGPSSGG